jgi:hypothetical protein
MGLFASVSIGDLANMFDTGKINVDGDFWHIQKAYFHVLNYDDDVRCSIKSLALIKKRRLLIFLKQFF